MDQPSRIIAQTPLTRCPPAANNPLLQAALAYHRAGRSVVPIAPGCKQPSLVDPASGHIISLRWGPYQEKKASRQQLRTWLAVDHLVGLGIVGGPVSGVTLPDGTRAGLEFLDFDDLDIHERFLQLVAARGALPLLKSLPCEETPRGRPHYGYLCAVWGRNTILARRQISTTAAGEPLFQTLVEVRAHGGQCIVAPTPAGIHPDAPARGYVMVWGSWAHVPVISPDARQLLFACATALSSAEAPRSWARPAKAVRRDRGCGGDRRPPSPSSAILRGEDTNQVNQKKPGLLGTDNPPQRRADSWERLEELFRSPWVAERCATQLGLPTEHIGRSFPCPLPGHAETHASATLYWRRKKTGALHLHCWHGKSRWAWFNLAEVRASQAFGKAVRLRGPSSATWQLHLLCEAGVLQPMAVPARPLPEEAPLVVRQVFGGVLLLLGCKWLYAPHTATAYTWRFTRAWCGIHSRRQIEQAMRWLLAHRYLRRVGTYKRMALYRPVLAEEVSE